jgi:hypothetical protein
MHPRVDCQRAVGASEGGPHGHAEEAIDSKGWHESDNIETVGSANDPIGGAPEGIRSKN